MGSMSWIQCGVLRAEALLAEHSTGIHFHNHTADVRAIATPSPSGSSSFSGEDIDEGWCAGFPPRF
jgi:hypothetical protein